jgi:hypothetical protein
MASRRFFSQKEDYISEIYFSKGVSENYFGNFIEAFSVENIDLHLYIYHITYT